MRCLNCNRILWDRYTTRWTTISCPCGIRYNRSFLKEQDMRKWNYARKKGLYNIGPGPDGPILRHYLNQLSGVPKEYSAN